MISQEEIFIQIDDYIAVTKAKAKLLDMIRNVNDRDDHTIAITDANNLRLILLQLLEHTDGFGNSQAAVLVSIPVGDIRGNRPG